jgi:tRNA1(Val) A37 N6-methylase TrmN6
MGFENDLDALALAGGNIALNGLVDRVEVRAADVTQAFSRLGLPVFDAVLANPPFFDDPNALRAPSPARRAAWIAAEGLGAWCAFLLKAVREKGTITLIHRADRLADIMAELAPKAGSFAVRPIHPFADAPAKRVLVRAIKTGKAPLRILPPLILHARAGAKHTTEAEAILRGAADLPWA